MANNSFSTKDGYLTFNGVTFTQLINDKLREKSVFTEQDLTGSNLAAIHQALGYVMSVAMLYVNEQSAENKFSDSNVYKNINRIVKELGYSPIGAQTSTLAFSLSAQNITKGFYVIPRYSSIDTGGVKYSTTEDIVFAKTSSNTIEQLANVSREKLLYQGSFVEHVMLSAVGTPNELMYLSVDDRTIIDHFNIHVYVMDSTNGNWAKWDAVDDLYTSSGTDKSFTIRLNHNKRYELQFGDGINGHQLNTNDQIAIYYLKTNGSGGEVGVGAIDNRTMIAFDTLRLREIIADTETSTFTRLSSSTMRTSLVFANTVGSTYFSNGDSVEDIRLNAPSTFRSQFRLVHQSDYASYVRTNFANTIHDVYVCNNSEYLNQYMRYYHDLGLVNPDAASRPLFNQVRFGTTCNFNNIYIVAVPKTANANVKSTLYLSPALKQNIKNAASKIKTATSELMFIDPVYLACDFGVPATNTIMPTDTQNSQLVIEQDSKSIKSPSLIQSEVATVLLQYFAITNQRIGQNVDISRIVSDITAINGVKQVYTINTITGTTIPGISMYVWDPMFANASVRNVASSFQLTNFQVAYLNNSLDIINRIGVKKEVRAYSTFDL